MSLSRKHCGVVSSYARMGLSDSTLASQWLPALHHRMREALKLRQESHMQDPNICVFDLSQSAHRIPSSHPHAEFSDVILMTAILPGSMFWLAFPHPGAGTGGCQLHSHLTEERPLTSEEHLLLQGWPIEGPLDLQTVPRSVQLSMAGNMFSSPVCLAVLASFFLSVPWATEDVAVEVASEAADAALSALSDF